MSVYELHEVKCLGCGKPIPCCFFYCISCEIKNIEKLEKYKDEKEVAEYLQDAEEFMVLDAEDIDMSKVDDGSDLD